MKKCSAYDQVRQVNILPAVSTIDTVHSAVNESCDENSIYEKIPE